MNLARRASAFLGSGGGGASPVHHLEWQGLGSPGTRKLRTCDLLAGLLQGRPPNPLVFLQMEAEGIFQGYP